MPARGALVLMVGPSGAGKDTLISGAVQTLHAAMPITVARRVVTRPVSRWEDHESLDAAAFARAEAEGRFCLSWQAHGLCYGIPHAEVAAVSSGHVVLCNVSRTVIEAARARLPQVVVVAVTASPQVLARRLAARGRPDDGDLRQRLRRSQTVGTVAADLVIPNDGEPQEAIDRLVTFLTGLRAGPMTKVVG